jgi:hypothetical protein
MIYNYVKRYLKNTLQEPNIDQTWSTIDNVKFFAYIQERYKLAEFEKELSETKQAFRDFFEPVGKLLFKYNGDSGIKIKVLPYSVQPQNSKHLKNIIKIITNNRKAIEYPYKGQTDQIAILGKIRRDINKELMDTQESVNAKELINYALRITLDLGPSDIITQLKRIYIIKIFQKNNLVQTVEPSKREGVQNRFNGYSAEEIEQTHKDVFHKNSVEEEYFIKNALKPTYTADLNFRTITNGYYEEKALKIIHSAIAKELSNYVSLEKDFLLGLTGYIMRRNFEKIHEFLAVQLIECVYEKNANANNFLMYYDGSVILIDNKKFKRPSLETQAGEKWNNASLIGICNLWMNTKKKKQQYEHKLIDTDMKIEQLESALEYIKPEKQHHENIIATTQPVLDAVEKTHSEMEAKLKYLEASNLNSNEYFEMLEKYKGIEKSYLETKATITEAKRNLKAIKDANASTYADLELFTKQKMQLLNDVKAQDLNIDSKSSQMDPILRSIAKVLMERTKAV